MSEDWKKKLLPIAEALNALSQDYKYHLLKYVFPDKGKFAREKYPAAMEIMRKGKEHRFRVFTGGNRSGKSFWLGSEIAYHVTGEYPEWWEGKVFKDIKTVWIIAESGALFRDSLQKLLFGDPGEEIGTGLLPLAEKNNGIGLVTWGAMPGTSGGAIGNCIVKHKKGHAVSIVVKTNEMTREQFQAASVDIVAFDEEPREDIYTECLMRLMGTGKKEPGIAMFAFTPLKGLSNVVLKFLPNGQFPEHGVPIEDKEKYICRVEWQDAPHLSEEDKETMIRQIPENERDARTKGIPALGSGRIYPVYEENIVVRPFEIPDYFPRAYSLDFGWNCTAALWAAQDPTTKVIYLYGEYYRGKTVPSIHALNIKARGDWIPGICDPSGGGRTENGRMLADLYRSLGLNLTDGDNDISGIQRNLDMFETGKIKVFSTLENFIKELRVYRYDTKNPSKPADKQNDHLMDCLKYLTSKFEWVARSVLDEEEDPDENFRKISIDRSRDDLSGY